MQFYPKLISPECVHNIFQVYRQSNNSVEIDGKLVDRHAPARVGHFMLSKFTQNEMSMLCNEVMQAMPDYKIVYCRVLKYNPGCFIPPHVDSYQQGQQSSDHSLIIQLSEPDSYSGGLPEVNNTKYYLDSTDALLYRYDELHAVTPVKKGIRYVANLRLQKIEDTL